MRIEPIVIIGAGPGGVAAAVQCRRLGIRPLLLDETGEAGGLVRHACAIENYPGIDPMNGPTFARLLQAHLARFQIRVSSGSVREIKKEVANFLVRTAQDEFAARVVIAAVGTAAKPMAVDGSEHLRYSPEFSVSKKDRRVVIAGSGEAALDYALSLANAGAVVTVLCRGPHLKTTGRLVDLVLQNRAIDICFQTRISAICPVEGGFRIAVSGADNKESIIADRAIAAIGRISRAPELLGALDEGPYMTVSTRLSGLYVIGDARIGTLGQIGMSVGDGLFAAMKAVLYLKETRDR